MNCSEFKFKLLKSLFELIKEIEGLMKLFDSEACFILIQTVWEQAMAYTGFFGKKFSRVDSVSRKEDPSEREGLQKSLVKEVCAHLQIPGTATKDSVGDASRSGQNSTVRRRRRGSSFNFSTLGSSTNKKPPGRNTLPPSRAFCLMEQENSRHRVKQELIREWKKEEKNKYKFISESSPKRARVVSKIFRKFKAVVFVLVAVHRLKKPSCKKIKTIVRKGDQEILQ